MNERGQSPFRIPAGTKHVDRLLNRQAGGPGPKVDERRRPVPGLEWRDLNKSVIIRRDCIRGERAGCEPVLTITLDASGAASSTLAIFG
jgi:hypothetical protein